MYVQYKGCKYEDIINQEVFGCMVGTEAFASLFTQADAEAVASLL